MEFKERMDAPLDVLNEYFANRRESKAEAERQAQECVGDLGRTDGEVFAHRDFQAGAIQDHPLGEYARAERAIDQCNVTGSVDQGIQPYLTTNAVVAVAEVLLLPSEANVGEKEYFLAHATYDTAFQDGYRQEALSEFDQQLESRFQLDMHGNPADMPTVDGSAIPGLSTPVTSFQSDSGYVPSNANPGHQDSVSSVSDTGSAGSSGSSSYTDSSSSSSSSDSSSSGGSSDAGGS